MNSSYPSISKCFYRMQHQLRVQHFLNLISSAALSLITSASQSRLSVTRNGPASGSLWNSTISDLVPNKHWDINEVTQMSHYTEGKCKRKTCLPSTAKWKMKTAKQQILRTESRPFIEDCVLWVSELACESYVLWDVWSCLQMGKHTLFDPCPAYLILWVWHFVSCEALCVPGVQSFRCFVFARFH